MTSLWKIKITAFVRLNGPLKCIMNVYSRDVCSLHFWKLSNFYFIDDGQIKYEYIRDKRNVAIFTGREIHSFKQFQ
jgi:hypothetical protein